MEIKLPLDANLQAALNKVSAAFPELKLNQVLEAKIAVNQAQLNLLTVNMAGKTLTLQTPLPLPFAAGQSLQLQVVKLLPTPEFKLIAPPLPANAKPTTGGEATLLKLTTAAAPAAGNPLPNLQLGQTVPAQVLSVGKQGVTLQLAMPLPASGQIATDNAAGHSPAQPITLDSRQLLEADPAKPALVPGSRIELQLVKAGAPPLFSVSLAPADLEAELVAAAFKQALPQQSSPLLMLNRLDHAVGELIADKTVGETLKHLALQILRAIPDKSALFQPNDLKTAVARSGLFLEAQLAQAGRQQAPPTLADDFKLRLSKFIAQLALELKPAAAEHSASAREPLLRELLQQAEGSLAKLTLDQLHSLPKDDAPRQVWVLELPFLQNGKPDLLELVVEHDRDGNGNPAGQNNWVVSITITPPELATIHCKLSCYDGSVNTRFWSESADTVEKINARLDYLRRQFEEKGLKPGFMDAQQGKPAQEHSPIASPQSLLSEKV
ncbi:flagellar hook-length control protein FliK [Methylomonas sp. EFPC3]|uniref:flagellar hook-length control protein FliK n=1 Tax=Methylomonas sp. EFPC3 TaxID=3021710 RepID=UPI00241725D5|nr:flagellar hook-length control protein FliK [Methylomonas sp. EFPC3]WFP51183.1 flagellar hook-length control protein FliK [Methylomonas sp. EFPC3]